MAGTRTAPTVDGTGTAYNTTLHLIDASGDQWAENILSLAAPTTAQVEAWVAAYQAASQASVWKVSTMVIYEGDKDADNANNLQRSSVKDGVNLLWKNVATLDTQTPRLIAPVAATMQGNQDIPLLTDPLFVALIAAEQALLTGYNLQSAQYTERRERSNNPRIKP